ncbi:hypothetical protein D3C76_1262120 [compost metagenome]
MTSARNQTIGPFVNNERGLGLNAVASRHYIKSSACNRNEPFFRIAVIGRFDAVTARRNRKLAILNGDHVAA